MECRRSFSSGTWKLLWKEKSNFILCYLGLECVIGPLAYCLLADAALSLKSVELLVLSPIHTRPDSSRIGLLSTLDRPAIHTIDESDMLSIAFAEWNHSALKVVCVGLLSLSDHFWPRVNAWIQYLVAPEALFELQSALFSSFNQFSSSDSCHEKFL